MKAILTKLTTGVMNLSRFKEENRNRNELGLDNVITMCYHKGTTGKAVIKLLAWTQQNRGLETVILTSISRFFEN